MSSKGLVSIISNKNSLTVILENKVYVHLIEGCSVFDNFATKENPKGIYAMNYDTDVAIQVVPSETLGSVEIHNYDTNKKITVKLHRNSLDILRISGDGKYQASASEIGNVIKLTQTDEGTVKRHFRTGADMSLVTDMAFTYDNSIQAVTKTNGDIQLFILLEEFQNCKNYNSWFKSTLGAFMSYFSHEWCISNITLPAGNRKIFFIENSYDLTAYDADGNVHIIDTVVKEDEQKIVLSIKKSFKINFN